VRRFVPALRRISAELKLPEPIKSRILLEMAADLEALYDHFRTRGATDEEAARLAEERVLVSPEALHHLVAVHTTGYQRWLGRAAERLRWGFDLLLFIAGVAPIAAVCAWLVAGELRGMLGDPLLWPLLVTGVVVVGLAAWKARQLFLGRVRSPDELHRGLSVLLFLAAASPVLGGTAFLIRLHGVAIDIMASRASTQVLLAAAPSVAQAATLLGLGLLLGIAAGLVSFVLMNRVATLEQAESAAMLAA
jgi:hypothetical protein